MEIKLNRKNIAGSEPPSFCEMVYELIALVPHGKLTTYKDIAENLGYPGYARQTAHCLSVLTTAAKNDPYKNIPWHRVIRSDMRVAFPPGSNKYQLQHKLLKAEGIVALPAKKTQSQMASISRSEPLSDSSLSSLSCLSLRFPAKYRHNFSKYY